MVTEELTLDGLITQLKKLRASDASLGEAQVRANCTDCSCWHLIERVRLDEWNGEPMVELGSNP